MPMMVDLAKCMTGAAQNVILSMQKLFPKEDHCIKEENK